MANRIKYNAGIDANSLNIGNWSVGLQGTGMGPTASTGFKNGVQIPAGGYAIYTEGVRVRIAINDADLVFILNKLGANVPELDLSSAINWARNNNVLVLSDQFNNMATDGLVLNLDSSQAYSFADNKPTVNFISNPTEEMPRGEFGQYRDLAPIFDANGLVPYSLSMDIKVNKPGSILVYMQNGSSSKYGFVYSWVNATTEYQRFYFENITPGLSDTSTGAATLAIYTGYGSGVNPTVKNIQLELGAKSTTFVNGTRTQGTNWYDLGTNNNNYSVSSNVYSSGIMNYSASQTELAPPASWQSTTDLTIELLYKPNTNGIFGGCCDTIFGRYDFRFFQIGSSLYTMIGFNDGSGGRIYQHPAYNVSYDKWHRIVGARRNNRYIIWIDGVEMENTAYGSGLNLYDVAGTWYISSSRHNNINVASSRIYNRGLNDNEILQNYYQAPIVTSGLVFAIDAGNLVSYENGSATTYNLAGAETGTLINGVSFDKGNGGSWAMDGSDDDIRTSLFTNARTNVTMSSWVYVNLGTVGTFINNGDDPGGYCIGIGQYFSAADNQIVALFGYIRWILTGAYYQYTGWHHIVMTLDGSGTPSIYVNGALIGTYPGTIANTPSAGAGFSLGSQWGIRYANSKYGNANFYNRALTQEEILQNYNAQAARFK